MTNTSWAEQPIQLAPLDFSQYHHIPIEDSGENLVQLSSFGIAGINYYHSVPNPPYYESIPGSISELWLRSSVAEKLAWANRLLRPYGREVYVLDAYRPLEVQQYIYHSWLPRYFRAKYPELPEADIQHTVASYWAEPPADWDSVTALKTPPHLTGAAVDLTIRYIDTQQWCEMGGVFDDVSQLSDVDYYERQNNVMRAMTFDLALQNRRILFHAMTHAGFAYHPNEWWHYSHGDQVWAHQTKADKAIYGKLKL